MAAIDVIMTAFENKTGKDKAVSARRSCLRDEAALRRQDRPQVWRRGLAWHGSPSSRLSQRTPCSVLFTAVARRSTSTRTADQGRGRRDVRRRPRPPAPRRRATALLAQEFRPQRADAAPWIRSRRSTTMACSNLRARVRVERTRRNCQLSRARGRIYLLIWDPAPSCSSCAFPHWKVRADRLRWGRLARRGPRRAALERPVDSSTCSRCVVFLLRSGVFAQPCAYDGVRRRRAACRSSSQRTEHQVGRSARRRIHRAGDEASAAGVRRSRSLKFPAASTTTCAHAAGVLLGENGLPAGAGHDDKEKEAKAKMKADAKRAR